MKRETREVPNQFARQRNEYVSEETARAGKFRIRNVSEDQLQPTGEEISLQPVSMTRAGYFNTITECPG